jgi:hypothetical protein
MLPARTALIHGVEATFRHETEPIGESHERPQDLREDDGIGAFRRGELDEQPRSRRTHSRRPRLATSISPSFIATYSGRPSDRGLRFTLYNLRHTFFSRLLAAGTPSSRLPPGSATACVRVGPRSTTRRAGSMRTARGVARGRARRAHRAGYRCRRQGRPPLPRSRQGEGERYRGRGASRLGLHAPRAQDRARGDVPGLRVGPARGRRGAAISLSRTSGRRPPRAAPRRAAPRRATLPRCRASPPQSLSRVACAGRRGTRRRGGDARTPRIRRAST